MNISFNRSFTQSFYEPIQKKLLSLTPQQKKIGIIAGIISLLATAILVTFYVTRYYYQSKPIHEQEKKISLETPTNKLPAHPTPFYEKKISSVTSEQEIAHHVISPKDSKPAEPPATPIKKASAPISKTPQSKIAGSPANQVGLTPGKLKALNQYTSNPALCPKAARANVFLDITSIKSSKGKSHGENNHATSVEDLMLYASGLDKIDLKNEACAQVILDTLRECNKETTEQLIPWIAHDKTLTSDLLKKCMEVFKVKNDCDRPFSVYALELIMRVYTDRKWHIAGNPQFLPSNDPVVISSVGTLLERNPNSDGIGKLVDALIKQPEYDLKTFSEWVRVYQKKEKEKAIECGAQVAQSIHYQHLDKILIHFKSKWGEKVKKELDKEKDIIGFIQKKLKNLPD